MGGTLEYLLTHHYNTNHYKESKGTHATFFSFCFVAAVIYASRTDTIQAASSNAANFELQALIAPIIGGITFDGGKGSVSGAFLGMVFIGLITNAMNMMQVSSYYQDMVRGIIIVIAVVISNIENIRKQFGMR